MKSDYGWDNNGNGTNSSGFTALPAGGLSEPPLSFYYLGNDGGFWSSTAQGNNYSVQYGLHGDGDYIHTHIYHFT